MRVARLVEASDALAATPSRNAKVQILAALFRDSGLETGVASGWLVGELRQGKIGLGYAAVYGTVTGIEGGVGGLSLDDVDHTLDAIAATKGAGSVGKRAALLERLLRQANVSERSFIVRLLTGELRQGALDGVVLAGLAAAFEAPEAAVRRAVMLAGSLPHIADVLAREGPAALARFQLELFRPVQPMLADTAASLDEVGDLRGLVLEAKLDGARIQVHKKEDEVRVYTRALHEVTAAVPEVVEAVRGLAATSLVLDGEVIAFAPSGRPQPFQTTMRRFGRKLDVEALRAAIPLTPVFFDVLRVDDDDLLAAPLEVRRARLHGLVPEVWRVPSLRAATLEEAQAFLDATLADGHEGLLAKHLDAPYEAGKRGASWLKLKPAKSLDLVVLAVEQGSGRRSKWLSNIHLGAYDPETGGFVMLGKTFKGMTDALLQWQTDELGRRALRQEGHVVWVRPELVVEILYQELEVSPRYPGGLALRFARVKGYRPDKRPEQADTIQAVRALFERQAGAGSPTTDESV